MAGRRCRRWGSDSVRVCLWVRAIACAAHAADLPAWGSAGGLLCPPAAAFGAGGRLIPTTEEAGEGHGGPRRVSCPLPARASPRCTGKTGRRRGCHETPRNARAPQGRTAPWPSVALACFLRVDITGIARRTDPTPGPPRHRLRAAAHRMGQPVVPSVREATSIRVPHPRPALARRGCAEGQPIPGPAAASPATGRMRSPWPVGATALTALPALPTLRSTAGAGDA